MCSALRSSRPSFRQNRRPILAERERPHNKGRLVEEDDNSGAGVGDSVALDPSGLLHKTHFHLALFQAEAASVLLKTLQIFP